jgi:diketogulonate reductase-like aldo/keto reductase
MASDGTEISRRELLRLVLAGGALAGATFAMSGTAAPAPSHRAIPRSGELLPVIGLGTWQTFNVGTSASGRAPLREVLTEFLKLGGKLVDSSPMYGESERVVGDLVAELGAQERLFLATKVWTEGRAAGIRQMEDSLRLLRTPRIDLMQVHNLIDWRTHLSTLRQWQEQKRIRYIGVTHYAESAYDELERVLKSEPLDFVQVNYSLGERAADQRILPLAAERGVAVIANRPFVEGALFRKVRGRELPPWAKEFDCASWGQFFLKFVISHPAITCTIPATSKRAHLVDNMGAGIGALPDMQARERMARYMAEL